MHFHKTSDLKGAVATEQTVIIFWKLHKKSQTVATTTLYYSTYSSKHEITAWRRQQDEQSAINEQFGIDQNKDEELKTFWESIVLREYRIGDYTTKSSRPRAGRHGSSEVTMSPSDTLGREFDPGKRDFSH